MRARGGPYEIVCVDDGSSDGTTQLLQAMAAERQDLRAVIFRRNFGQTAAMAAGFDFAAGELLVTMDGDLQNDADDIPRILDKLLYGETGQGGDPGNGAWGSMPRDDGGYDMVVGWRRHRKDDVLTRNIPSAAANWLIGRVTGVKLHDYGCSLKAYRASVVSSLRLYGEMHRFIPALAAMEGASISELEVQHAPRLYGASKYGLGRIPRVLLDLATIWFLSKYRDRPMQLVGLLGILCLLSSMAFGVAACWSFATSARSYGVAMALSSSMAHAVASLELLVMGSQLMCLGFLSEICIRTYFESQPRPVYRVREVATSTA
eukprot:SM000004S15148  [mRNA]  locus=s4:1489783:1492115:+ [translate_table: standard]